MNYFWSNKVSNCWKDSFLKIEYGWYENKYEYV